MENRDNEDSNWRRSTLRKAKAAESSRIPTYSGKCMGRRQGDGCYKAEYMRMVNCVDCPFLDREKYCRTWSR